MKLLDIDGQENNINGQELLDNILTTGERKKELMPKGFKINENLTNEFKVLVNILGMKQNALIEDAVKSLTVMLLEIKYHNKVNKIFFKQTKEREGKVVSFNVQIEKTVIKDFKQAVKANPSFREAGLITIILTDIVERLRPLCIDKLVYDEKLKRLKESL